MKSRQNLNKRTWTILFSYDEMDCAMHAGQEKTDDMGKCAYNIE
jgi:hypothetical protein